MNFFYARGVGEENNSESSRAVPEFEGGEVDLVVNIYRKDNNVINTAKVYGANGGDGGNDVNFDDELSDEEIKIKLYLADYPTATQKEISVGTNIPLRTVQRILPRLQKIGFLVREGNRRFGSWKVLE